MRKYRMKIVLITLSVSFASFVSQGYAEEPLKSFNERFGEFLKEAPALKDISLQKAAKHKIEDNIEKYTANPEQIAHYKEENLDTIAMEQKAAKESVPDAVESPRENAGQIVAGSFKKRMVYKIDKNDPDVVIAKDIEANPEKHAKVTFDTKASCQKKKTLHCEETFSEKRCEEQVRALTRICEKVPKITTSTRDIVYPNCKNLIITQHVNSHCPSGYSEVLYADMVHTRDNHWDDIRFCTRAVSVGETPDCYSGGYYIATNHKGYYGSERATVPKKLHARIKISNVYFEPVKGTIINETTGQTISNNEGFTNGRVVELPYSETQDQTFRFYAVKPGGGGGDPTGIMTLYVDNIQREKVANVESWQETNCSDI